MSKAKLDGLGYGMEFAGPLGGVQRIQAQNRAAGSTLTLAPMDMNLALLMTLAQPIVKGVLTNTPPVSPAAGDAYVVGTSPTGAWVGFNNQVAIWDGTAWQFSGTPKAGWRVSDAGSLNTLRVWSGTAWISGVLTPTTTQLVLNDQSAFMAVGRYSSGLKRAIFAAGGDGTNGDTSVECGIQLKYRDAGAAGQVGLDLASNGLVTIAGGINLGQQDLTNYSTGTWTPTIQGAGGSAGAYAASLASAKYVRVGTMCFATFQIGLTNKGSWTGITSIAGLPYAASGSNQSATLGLYDNITVAGGRTQVSAITTNAATTLTLIQSGGGIADTSIDYTAIANTTFIYGTIVYAV